MKKIEELARSIVMDCPLQAAQRDAAPVAIAIEYQNRKLIIIGKV